MKEIILTVWLLVLSIMTLWNFFREWIKRKIDSIDERFLHELLSEGKE